MFLFIVNSVSGDSKEKCFRRNWQPKGRKLTGWIWSDPVSSYGFWIRLQNVISMMSRKDIDAFNLLFYPKPKIIYHLPIPMVTKTQCKYTEYCSSTQN